MRDDDSTHHPTPSERDGRNADISHDELLHMLEYQPDTGEFLWLQHPSRTDLNGLAAGCVRPGGIAIKINGVRYRAHRLAWFYMTGWWPHDFIDHVNGNPCDNRWSNLRAVDRSINAQNRRSASANKQGADALGVHFHKKSGKYQASITATLGGKKMQLYLGLHESEQDAYAVYVDAKRLLHDGATI